MCKRQQQHWQRFETCNLIQVGGKHKNTQQNTSTHNTALVTTPMPRAAHILVNNTEEEHRSQPNHYRLDKTKRKIQCTCIIVLEKVPIPFHVQDKFDKCVRIGYVILCVIAIYVHVLMNVIFVEIKFDKILTCLSFIIRKEYSQLKEKLNNSFSFIKNYK